MPGQLSGGRGLARALQSGEQNDRGRRGTQIQRRGFAHHRHQFVMHDLDQHLPGREAPGQLGADRAFLYLFDELAYHRQRHIGFQQRHANFPQGILDIVIGQATLAAHAVEDGGQPGGKILEHGCCAGGNERARIIT